MYDDETNNLDSSRTRQVAETRRSATRRVLAIIYDAVLVILFTVGTLGVYVETRASRSSYQRIPELNVAASSRGGYTHCWHWRCLVCGTSFGHASGCRADAPCESKVPAYGTVGPIHYVSSTQCDARLIFLNFPNWLPFAMAIPTGFILTRRLVLGPIRRRRRRQRGECLPCGYSLTGNVSGRCPECGATTEPARAAGNPSSPPS